MDAQQVAHPLVAFRFGRALEGAFAPQVNAEPETSKTPPESGELLARRPHELPTRQRWRWHFLKRCQTRLLRKKRLAGVGQTGCVRGSEEPSRSWSFGCVMGFHAARDASKPAQGAGFEATGAPCLYGNHRDKGMGALRPQACGLVFAR